MSCEEYRVFLEEFHTDEELLTIKVGTYRLTESEILGEVINWTLQYLSENKCPTKLSAPITRNVVETIQSECRKDPQLCGYDENEKTFEPSKLKNLVILALNTFCQRLLDNVELNKILPDLSGKDYTPLCTTGAIRNKRRAMEDRHICIDDFNETYSIQNASKASFYAVFDGHDGYHAAYYSVSQLPYLLASGPLYPLNPAEAMRQSFRGTDIAFVQKTYQQSIRGGTTAVCALYLPDESRLYVGWVGDSRALLVKQGKIMQIVKPHKPEDPKEKKRIYAAGGTVINWSGIWRVDGLLNLSRAIGDSKCKPYVTGDPDIVGLELDKNEDFLVLGCDGLWDYVAEDKVAEIIYQQLNDDTENLNKIPQKLIEKSKQEGSTDNITIVIVFLKDPYLIVKNTCTIEIMEPAFDNCNIGEFTNSEQVLNTNANTTQNDYKADPSKEYFDDNQQQDEHLNSNQLIQQFNDGLNNFLQDPKNICTNMMSNLNNHQFELKTNFEQNDQVNVEENFLNDLTKKRIENLNEQLIDEMAIVETPVDYEHEACIDVTDDIAMVTTENSENSTISHSKDTLPLSDNFNPFDNKLSLDNRSEYNPDNVDYLHNDDTNDDSKSTPMISPDSEEIMNQGSDDIISPEYEQPMLEELASGVEILKQIDNSEPEHHVHQHQENFENDFIQTNGHISPEKQIVYDNQQIYNNQQEHISELNSDILKEIDYKNEEMHQSDCNINHSEDEGHQNAIFGLNSIKENHFESNYIDGFSDLGYSNQNNLLVDEEKRSDIMHDEINILNSNEIIEGNLSPVNELNPNLISEELLKPEKEEEIVEDREEQNETVYIKTENIFDDGMVEINEQNIDTDDKVQNIENSLIHEENFTEQNMESNAKQPDEELDIKHQAQNLEDDGFAEQEFAEHDNFDEQNFDQLPAPQNPSVGSEIEKTPISQQQESNVLDESEDEWQYMRLKKNEETIEASKILDNREEIVDSTDKSIDSNQHIPTEISLEERRDLSKEEQEIVPSSPKIIANLNKTPIATDLDDDMNYQLNPEAKEFIPLSPPTATNVFLEGDNNNGLILNGDGLNKITQQQHLVGDDVVAQSPRKGSAINMDEIYVPEQTEFDIEVRHRPHEIIESAQKVAVSTVAALEEINDGNGDQQELYQELNLKEAMHGSEKEEPVLSPTIDVAGDSNEIKNPIFNPVAEFENIDMKDSIYIEKSSSNQQQQEQQQKNNEFDTNEDLLNSVQLIPDHFDSNKSSSTEFILKEDMVSNENEKDIASPTNEIITITNSSLSVNGLSSQENNDEKIQNITNDLNILKLSSDDTSINESSNDAIDIDTSNAAPAAVAIAATTIAAAGVTAAAMSPTTDDKNTKTATKVAEKNIKNKINTVKSPKVPEKKLSATTTAALTKIATSTQPKKVPSTSSKTSVTSNKPKTLTVATAPAPKTLTFPRPRTAPAATGTTKSGTNFAGTTTTTTTKSRIDTNRPATLTVKKPLTNKTTSTTIESKTNTIKSNVSKTGVSAKSSATSRTSVTTNVMSKPRPASATTANGSSGSVTTSKSQTRPASVKSTSKPPLSPRGTFTSALRKTEAIKSPTKSTTATVATTANTGRLKGTTTTTTRTTLSSTAPKTSGTVRKTTTTTTTTHTSSLAPGKTSNAVPKKITPIKRPTLVKKELSTGKEGSNDNSLIDDTVKSTSIETDQQVNGVAPVSIDLTTV